MTKSWDEDKGLNAQMKAAAPMHRVLNLRRWQAW